MSHNPSRRALDAHPEVELAPASFTCCSVRIDACSPEAAVHHLMTHSSDRRGRAVHLCNAYTLSLARRDTNLLQRLNRSDLNLPDGMPLVWIGRRLGLDALQRRVYGPDLMLATMAAGRDVGLRHFLYGATDDTLDALRREIERRVPGTQIAGSEAPPFRDLSRSELLHVERRMKLIDPDIVWVGLGTPRQDLFVDEMRCRLPSTLVAVGAAFDFISGKKAQAPVWMQERGLEWLHRLVHEPRRLWRRYLFGNLTFLAGVLRERPELVT